MGTRCLTYVYDEETDTQPFVCLYRQLDGYPAGHGKELSYFLNSLEMVNGFDEVKRPTAHGMGCLAAQMVALFKKGVGRVYLLAPDLNQDVWQNYTYHVFPTRVSIFCGLDLEFIGTYQELSVFVEADQE